MSKVRPAALLAAAGMALVTVAGLAMPASARATSTIRATGAPFIRAFVVPATINTNAFGSDAVATGDGGYVVAGVAGNNIYDGWVAKLSPSGLVQWQEELGCGESGFSSVRPTADGGYVLGGYSNGCDPDCVKPGVSFPDCAWVVKLSAAGAVEWQQVFTGDDGANAAGVRQAGDGGYYVAGSTEDGTGTSYAWVARLAADGNIVWQRRIGSPASTQADSVVPTADGGVAVSGSTGFSGDSSILAAKLDGNGNLQWQETFSPGYYDGGYSIQQTTDGGYIVGGQVTTPPSPGGSVNDGVLLKLGPRGTVQWERRYTSPGTEYAGSSYVTRIHSVIQTASGGYALAGDTSFPAENRINAPITGGSWLATTDASGNITAQNVYYPVNPGTGLPYATDFYGLAQASDGGLAAIGYADEYHNSDDVWLVRTAPDLSAGASCSEVHTVRNLNTVAGGLTATASSLPETSPPVSGGAATVISGAATPDLTSEQDC